MRLGNGGWQNKFLWWVGGKYTFWILIDARGKRTKLLFFLEGCGF